MTLHIHVYSWCYTHFCPGFLLFHWSKLPTNIEMCLQMKKTGRRHALLTPLGEMKCFPSLVNLHTQIRQIRSWYMERCPPPRYRQLCWLGTKPWSTAWNAAMLSTTPAVITKHKIIEGENCQEVKNSPNTKQTTRKKGQVGTLLRLAICYDVWPGLESL